MFSTLSPSRPSTASVKLDTLTAPAPDPGVRFLDFPVELCEKILVEAIASDVNQANLLLVAKPLEVLVASAWYRVLNTALIEQKKYGEETITQAQWVQLQKPACFLGRIAKKARSNPLPPPMPDEKIEEYAKMPQRIRDAGADKMAASLSLTKCRGEEALDDSHNAMKAETVILDAYRTGATELDITDLRLSRLPKEIAYLTNLEGLYASGNRLTTLPEWIDQLSRLKRLFVDINSIEALSPKIGRLSVLEELNVSLNRLQDLDPEIGRLVKLKYLNVSFNELSQLPDTIEHLRALQVLNISSNQFNILPMQIGKLEALKTFDIFNNLVTEIPNEIKPFLRNLDKFCVSHELVESM